MQQRGFTPSIIEDAILNGQIVPSANPDTINYFHTRNNITVVTNSNGGVVTLF
jgi:hypothetical protein